MSWGEPVAYSGPPIAGYCPMGCGGTLYRDVLGRVVCHSDACPWPYAASDILDDFEHEHLVTFTRGSWSIQRLHASPHTGAVDPTCAPAATARAVGEALGSAAPVPSSSTVPTT